MCTFVKYCLPETLGEIRNNGARFKFMSIYINCFRKSKKNDK